MTRPLDLTTSHHAIATNRGRLRIWLDGRRLTAAGFTGGRYYRAAASPGVIVLATDPLVSLDGDVMPRRVTGRPDGKPIIDLTGGQVSAAFPAGGHIMVAYQPGFITIMTHLRNT